MNRNFISNSNFVLRKVLNSEENIDIIQDFIETFLDIKIKEIHLNPYLKSKEKYLPSEEKFGVADVRIKLIDDEEINVGIQFIDGYYIQRKMLLYYAQIHSNQLEYDNRKMVKTITINILDFEYLKSERYHQKIYISSNPNKNGEIEKYELHVLELPKFNENAIINIDKEEAWMTYLKGERKDLITKILNKYGMINKMDKLLDEFWKNENID